MDTAPEDPMPKAEVALRFAIWLLSFPDAAPSAEVGIDRSAARVFPVRAILGEEGWRCSEPGGGRHPPYQGIYTEGARTIRLPARPGVGELPMASRAYTNLHAYSPVAVLSSTFPEIVTVALGWPLPSPASWMSS